MPFGRRSAWRLRGTRKSGCGFRTLTTTNAASGQQCALHTQQRFPAARLPLPSLLAAFTAALCCFAPLPFCPHASKAVPTKCSRLTGEFCPSQRGSNPHSQDTHTHRNSHVCRNRSFPSFAARRKPKASAAGSGAGAAGAAAAGGPARPAGRPAPSAALQAAVGQRPAPGQAPRGAQLGATPNLQRPSAASPRPVSYVSNAPPIGTSHPPAGAAGPPPALAPVANEPPVPPAQQAQQQSVSALEAQQQAIIQAILQLPPEQVHLLPPEMQAQYFALKAAGGQ